MATKIINPAGWNFDRQIVLPIKIGSRGLIGNDRRDFLKTASPLFLDIIDNVKFAKDEEPVHILALGDTDMWGPNRNGDGFRAEVMREFCGTFTKHARWYRNHKNRDTSKSYGIIKKAGHNDAMHRVELLAALNREKSAAERNGGLVADEELNLIHRGEDIPVSMACTISHDVCSGCGNKARTRKEYCTDKTCKYGGCQKNLAKVAADGHVLYVDNIEPRFFDISKVYRGADRTAFAVPADYAKAAADDILPGYIAAEQWDITAPADLLLDTLPTRVVNTVKLARALAHFYDENQPTAAELKAAAVALSTAAALSNDLLSTLGKSGSKQAAANLSALADRKVILPLPVFARWLGKEAVSTKAASAISAAFANLGCDESLEKLAHNPYLADASVAASNGAKILGDALVADYGFTAESVAKRAMLGDLRGANPKVDFDKSAADDHEATALAEAYALYQVAAFSKIAESDNTFPLTIRMVMHQNGVVGSD